MARPKMKPVEASTPANEPIGANIEVLQSQAAERSAMILQQFGDGLPYERVRFVHETRFYMAQSAEALLEAGKRLIVIKEHEPHGEFTQIVEEQLGLSARTARVMMQAAVKYMSPQLESKRQALAVLGKTKLLELVTESDDDLAALADGGTLHGLKLDDIDTMTSRELKAALREAREEGKAKDQLLSDKNTKLDKLQSDMAGMKRKLAKVDPDEEIDHLRREFTTEANAVEQAIRQVLHDGASKLMSKGDHTMFIAGLLLPIQDALARIRDDFQIPQAEASDVIPEWTKQ